MNAIPLAVTIGPPRFGVPRRLEHRRELGLDADRIAERNTPRERAGLEIHATSAPNGGGVHGSPPGTRDHVAAHHVRRAVHARVLIAKSR